MNNTRLLQVSLVVLMLLVNMSLFAQEFSVTKTNNSIRVGDNIQKQQIEYVDAGDSGEDVVWDVSDLSPVKNYPVEFYCDSDSVVIYELTPEIINKYIIDGDTLAIVGIEMPLKRIDYMLPVKYLAYPSNYGDYFTAPYHGTGIYCKTHLIDHQGNVDVEADATGTLILSEDDTLRNVIRIHSIRTGSLYMHHENDSTLEARNRIKQEIEERYQWYARGYRYPIVETVSTSYYDDMDLISCLQSAYIYAPSMQALLNDKLNEDILRADSIADALNARPDIIHYNVNTNGGSVNISYSLDDDANITVVVCNHRGMAYRRRSLTMPSGTGYEMSIDCTGLQADTYILYINVNGKVYSEKVNIE